MAKGLKDSQRDGFTGSTPKSRNLGSEAEAFGARGKPSGFRGKSIPGEPECNLDKLPTGSNVGGGAR